MAATKYQILYRYINEATNSVITNSTQYNYDETCEFYVDNGKGGAHKIYSNDEEVKLEAINEQQEMIAFGNSASNPKTNMLFAYDGTKKIKHKTWVGKTVGYVVRDWRSIKRSLIGNQGDFSKDFTTLDASTPEDGGIVVCTKAVMEKYFEAPATDASKITVTTQGEYTSGQMQALITNATIFALNTDSWEEHMQASKTYTMYPRNAYSSNNVCYYGPILMNGVQLTQISGYFERYSTTLVTRMAQMSNTNLYSAATITKTQLQTVEIPGHYEDVADSPYLIKDTYKRIELDPWFVNSTFGSLEAAITKAKLLVDMLGIDNVKLIKLVPIDQFIRIK